MRARLFDIAVSADKAHIFLYAGTEKAADEAEQIARDALTLAGKKVQGEALILDDEGAGHVVDTDFHGVDWDHHKYIVEVRPAGGEPFRAETKAKVAIFHKPQPGDVVKVSFDPKSHKTEIHIEGDPRYDPKLIRTRNKQDRAARAEALLSGAPAPAAPGVVHYIADDEPRWNVPATCPECGARVDQSTASFAEHPVCTYCAKPLPCEPVSTEDY